MGLIAILVVVWVKGQDLREEIGREAQPPVSGREASPEAVAEVLQRYQRVADREVSEAQFSDVEVEGLLNHFSGFLPAGASEASVRFEGSEIRVGLRVAIADLPPAAELERLRMILPDTAPGELRGAVFGVGDGEAVFLVRRIDVSGVPLPRSLVPHILRYLGAEGREDLPPEAVPLSLPPGIRTIYVDGDRLVLTGYP